MPLRQHTTGTCWVGWFGGLLQGFSSLFLRCGTSAFERLNLLSSPCFSLRRFGPTPFHPPSFWCVLSQWLNSTGRWSLLSGPPPHRHPPTQSPFRRPLTVPPTQSPSHRPFTVTAPTQPPSSWTAQAPKPSPSPPNDPPTFHARSPGGCHLPCRSRWHVCQTPHRSAPARPLDIWTQLP
jgi:hypothetical protein